MPASSVLQQPLLPGSALGLTPASSVADVIHISCNIFGMCKTATHECSVDTHLHSIWSFANLSLCMYAPRPLIRSQVNLILPYRAYLDVLVVVNSKSCYDRGDKQDSSWHTCRLFSAVFCIFASTESTECFAAGPSYSMTEAWHDSTPPMWQ